MTSTPLVKRAHEEIQRVLKPGAIAIDCTVGNGHDTAFLARMVGEQGKVYGFDIQQQALDRGWQRLREQNLEKQVALFHAGHELLPTLLPVEVTGHVKAIMFNLGYLPGSDKSRITHTSTTLSALEAALPLLAPGGCISILAYAGHAGGQQESEAVQQWVNNLPDDLFNVTREASVQQKSSNPANRPPVLITIEKR
jgi:16S rRNA C1402 N4-methylase RsmH